jgi:hypothetical protein
MPSRMCLAAVAACLAWAAAGVTRAQDEPASPPAAREAPDARAKRDAPTKPARKPDKPNAPDDAKAADEAALREVLKTLARSLQDGKADGIRQVLHAANPTERKMVDAMAAMAVQIAGLYRVSAKAFGEDEARGLTGDVAAEMSRIDKAQVSIDGDTATVRYAGGEADPPAEGEPSAAAAPPAAEGQPAPAAADESSQPPAMLLKRVDGRWRVPMSELSKDATPEGIEQRLADLAVQTRVISELAKDVAKGKYRTADEAAEAWHAKMMQALTPGKPPEGGKGGGAGDRESDEGEGEERGRAKSDRPETPADTPDPASAPKSGKQ